MLTYQVRERIYRHAENYSLDFPNPVELLFVFQPLQPFGSAPGGGRTAVRGVEAVALCDPNTGHHSIESEQPLNPLEVIIEEPRRTTKLQGNVLSITTHCENIQELDEIVQSVFFGFPMLLGVEFADPPVVERLEGRVGDVPFRWELKEWSMEFDITTQEIQEQKVVASWQRFNVLSQEGNRRIIAALHYFHIACRLSRAANSPWEFMSEVIVNLSKILEVLFPPAGNGQTREAARVGLRQLGYTEDEINRDFIPAMLLRNNIDSAHVDLSLFTREQLRILHTYTESAELAFRSMLRRLFTQIEAEQFQVEQYISTPARQEAINIINRLGQYFASID